MELNDVQLNFCLDDLAPIAMLNEVASTKHFDVSAKTEFKEPIMEFDEGDDMGFDLFDDYTPVSSSRTIFKEEAQPVSEVVKMSKPPQRKAFPRLVPRSSIMYGEKLSTNGKNFLVR